MYRRAFKRFIGDRRGSIAIQFAIAMVPITAVMGGAVDYTRAGRVRADLQSSLDSAVLAAVKLKPEEAWSQRAADVFAANAPAGYEAAQANFVRLDDGSVRGNVSAVVTTELVNILGINQINVGVTSVAASGENYGNSCILALDAGASLSSDGITLNGAPNINLNQCTLRSNTSLRCNGHDSGAIAAIGAGSSVGCNNPVSNANVLPDLLAPVAANITKKCGSVVSSTTWTAGTIPASVITVDLSDRTEYHVCGDLTVTGNGYLTGSAPTKDRVIVIENGSLTIGDKSTLSTSRTAIVFTGNNTRSSSITFPNGNGKASSLTLSPPTTEGNPWRGISLYQDPALTLGVDHNWGPAATFNPDGVVYMPNSNLLMRGNSGSGLSGCTKVVVRTLRTNGAVDLQYTQNAGVCADLGVDRFDDEDVAPYISM